MSPWFSDLHHRNGWRKSSKYAIVLSLYLASCAHDVSSSSYGKQTRIWDVLFGTTRPRIEMVPENIDWSK